MGSGSFDMAVRIVSIHRSFCQLSTRFDFGNNSEAKLGFV